jgi:hypothetical protein
MKVFKRQEIQMIAALDGDETGWVKNYAGEVTETFTKEFQATADRFRSWQQLIDRFTKAVDFVLKNGHTHFKAVDEAHNELCIASATLSIQEPKITRLEYEPVLSGTAKSIDFRATADNGLIIYIDVKTIKPESKDRWEQFKRAVEEKWLPERVTVTLAKEWLGGELWHCMFTARARMLEHALELEKKIADGKLAAKNVALILALCGDGFCWHKDQLEDFVSFYRSREHRADDPFSRTELKYMAEKKLHLNRTISSFAFMSRQQGAVRQRRLNWHVLPPRNSFI